MKMMNRRPCMKCGGKIKYKEGGKYPKMQIGGTPPNCDPGYIPDPKDPTKCIPNPNIYGITVPNIQFPSVTSTTTLLPIVPPGIPTNIQNTGNPPGMNIWQPGWVNPINPTEQKPTAFDNTSPSFTGKTGYNPFAQKMDPNQTGPQQKIGVEEYILNVSTTTTTTLYKPRVDPEVALKAINRGINFISNIVDQSRQAGPDSYLVRQLSTLGQRINNPIPWWATNEQKQVSGYDLYTGTVGGNKMKKGGTNMNKSITTQTTEPPYKGWMKKRIDEINQKTWNEITDAFFPTIPMGIKPYIPLSQDELSALAHQFRGMGSDKSTYAMIPQGSGIDNIGYLTPRERKQLSDYMNSRNTFQSIWEGLPNLLGASGAAALPESSRLIKDRTMRNSYFPGSTGYTDWVNYMENQGYKKGGMTNNKTNNMIKIKEENKGKFTAQAKRAGMGVQEFANYVLGNPDKFSTSTVKRANFAKNAAGWKKEFGGMTYGNPYYDYYQDGGPIPMGQEQQPMMGEEGGNEDQLQQIIMMIIEALQEGMSPEDILAALVKMGIPQEQAMQLLQAVVERMQQGAGGQGAPMQQQAAPMMAYGGKSMPNNEGFRALPDYVQEKIMSNMQQGGKMNDQMNMIIKSYAQMKGIDPEKVMEMIQQELQSGAQLNTILKSLQMEMQQSQQGMQMEEEQGMMAMGGPTPLSKYGAYQDSNTIYNAQSNLSNYYNNKKPSYISKIPK